MSNVSDGPVDESVYLYIIFSLGGVLLIALVVFLALSYLRAVRGARHGARIMRREAREDLDDFLLFWACLYTDASRFPFVHLDRRRFGERHSRSRPTSAGGDGCGGGRDGSLSSSEAHSSDTGKHAAAATATTESGSRSRSHCSDSSLGCGAAVGPGGDESGHGEGGNMVDGGAHQGPLPAGQLGAEVGGLTELGVPYEPHCVPINTSDAAESGDPPAAPALVTPAPPADRSHPECPPPSPSPPPPGLRASSASQERPSFVRRAIVTSGYEVITTDSLVGGVNADTTAAAASSSRSGGEGSALGGALGSAGVVGYGNYYDICSEKMSSAKPAKKAGGGIIEKRVVPSAPAVEDRRHGSPAPIASLAGSQRERLPPLFAGRPVFSPRGRSSSASGSANPLRPRTEPAAAPAERFTPLGFSPSDGAAQAKASDGEGQERAASLDSDANAVYHSAQPRSSSSDSAELHMETNIQALASFAPCGSASRAGTPEAAPAISTNTAATAVAADRFSSGKLKNSVTFVDDDSTNTNNAESSTYSSILVVKTALAGGGSARPNSGGGSGNNNNINIFASRITRAGSANSSFSGNVNSAGAAANATALSGERGSLRVGVIREVRKLASGDDDNHHCHCHRHHQQQQQPQARRGGADESSRCRPPLSSSPARGRFSNSPPLPRVASSARPAVPGREAALLGRGLNPHTPPLRANSNNNLSSGRSARISLLPNSSSNSSNMRRLTL